MRLAIPHHTLPQVLVLSYRLPFPPDRGDRIRKYHMIAALARHADVSLLVVEDQARLEPGHIDVVRSLTRRLHVERITPLGGGLRAAAALLTGDAATPAYPYRRRLARLIQSWHAFEPFDAVVTYHSAMLPYAAALTRRRLREEPSPRHLFDLCDVDSVKWRQYAQTARTPWWRWAYQTEARRLTRYESGQRVGFDLVTLVCEREAGVYRKTVNTDAPIHVMRQGVDLDYFQAQPTAPGPARLVFTGVLNYTPNVDGVLWFVRRVWPLLQQRLPDTTLTLVGRTPDPAIRKLDSLPNIRVVGQVDDIRPHLAHATAAIVPLRIARGLQTKVLEAMASARPVVLSPAAAEGILAKDGSELLVAREARHWVDQIERLHRDDALRHNLGEAARACVEAKYGWEMTFAPLPRLVLGHTPTPAARPVHKLEQLLVRAKAA